MADIGYARVSKRVQNLDLQLDALERAGCDPIFSDKLSGARDDRPELAKALSTVQSGDSLIVWRLDRVARSMQNLVSIIGDLQQRGVRFRSLNESIDTSGATGELVFHILAALAQFERKLIIERTTAGLEAARARGRVGGPTPYGIGPDRVSIVEQEAELLREAAARLLAGEALAHVVDDWHEQGLRPRHAKRWRETALRRMLRNERVIPILGQEVHDGLERLFTAPGRQRLGRRAKHLLSGILRCGVEGCGQPLYAVHVDRTRLVYVCRKTSGGRFNGCGSISISLPRTDAWMVEAFIAAFTASDSPLPARLAARLSACRPAT